MKTRFTYFTVLLVAMLLGGLSVQAQSGSLEGTIIGRKGNIISIKPDHFTGTDPQLGTVGDMSKYFDEKMGQMTMSGWMGVAKVEFVPTSHQNTDIKILEEKSEILVNGEKVDHFKLGKRIKIEWPAQADTEPAPAPAK
jgi:hypothetical protein